MRPPIFRSARRPLGLVLAGVLVLGNAMCTNATGPQPQNPTTTMLSLNSRMAREHPAQIHPDVVALLGRLVSSGNSSQEAFFGLDNVPEDYADDPRIRHWTDEHISTWSKFLVANGIELVPSVNMYEPVEAQIAGWQRFANAGVRINHILFGGEFYLPKWFDGSPATNGMLGQVRIDRSFDGVVPPDSDARYYLEVLDEYLPAFREAFPHARLYINACTTREGGGLRQEYRRYWTERVRTYAAAHPTLIHGYRFHVYAGSLEGDVAGEEQIELLENIAAQIDALDLPIYLAEGGQRDAHWNEEGLARLRTYVLTIGNRLRARDDGSIQGFHIANLNWSPAAFPQGHPHALSTTAGQLHYYFPEEYEAGSDDVVLTPIGAWFVDNWRTVFD
jgi:hypothetical protein